MCKRDGNDTDQIRDKTKRINTFYHFNSIPPWFPLVSIIVHIVTID